MFTKGRPNLLILAQELYHQLNRISLIIFATRLIHSLTHKQNPTPTNPLLTSTSIIVLTIFYNFFQVIVEKGLLGGQTSIVYQKLQFITHLLHTHIYTQDIGIVSSVLKGQKIHHSSIDTFPQFICLIQRMMSFNIKSPPPPTISFQHNFCSRYQNNKFIYLFIYLNF